MSHFHVKKKEFCPFFLQQALFVWNILSVALNYKLASLSASHFAKLFCRENEHDKL